MKRMLMYSQVIIGLFFPLRYSQIALIFADEDRSIMEYLSVPTCQQHITIEIIQDYKISVSLPIPKITDL